MTRMTSPAKQPAVRWTQNRNSAGVMGRLSSSNFRPAPQQVVIDAGELHDGGIVRLRPGFMRWMAVSRSNSSVRWPSSRTMLWIQKNDDSRDPRVTGVTWCRLVEGYRIMCPAGSFT